MIDFRRMKSREIRAIIRQLERDALESGNPNSKETQIYEMAKDELRSRRK